MLKEIQNTGFKKLFYISVFHEMQLMTERLLLGDPSTGRIQLAISALRSDGALHYHNFKQNAGKKSLN
jgi:hypothetical protein